MDGLQAAILRVKLPHLPAWTDARKRAAAVYDELFAPLDDVEVPYVAPDREHVFHLYMIKIDNRDAIRQHLTERGVASVVNYSRAVPFFRAYERLGHVPSDFPLAYANQHRILSIPIFPEITRHQQEYVVASIQEGLANSSGCRL